MSNSCNLASTLFFSKAELSDLPALPLLCPLVPTFPELGNIGNESLGSETVLLFKNSNLDSF